MTKIFFIFLFKPLWNYLSFAACNRCFDSGKLKEKIVAKEDIKQVFHSLTGICNFYKTLEKLNKLKHSNVHL